MTPESIPLPTLTARVHAEMLRMRMTQADLAQIIGVGQSQVSKNLKRGHLDQHSLACMAMCGFDIQFILIGERISATPSNDLPYVRTPDVLEAMFGDHVRHMPPDQLLGGLLCQHHQCAPYTLGNNPYPVSAPHHYGVRVGWEMAHKQAAEQAGAGAA